MTGLSALLPGLLVAVAVWWASTGLVLWLVRRSEPAVDQALMVGAALGAGSVAALAVAARDPGIAGSLLGFMGALTIWGWHELAFLTGRLAGARREGAPPRGGFARFRAAADAVMHHELALAATGLAVLAVSWGGANPTGLITFGLLFGMRLSTKLNIFLGVANPPVAFLPAALEHLRVWFVRRRLNALMPLSLFSAAGVTWQLADAALDPTASPGLEFGFALTTGLAALGLIEHLFLMTPAPDRALWGWALGKAAREPRA